MRLFFRLSTLNHNLLRVNMMMISFTSILLFIRLSYTTTPLRVISHCIPIPFILIHRSILSQPYLYEPSTRQHNTAESYSIDSFHSYRLAIIKSRVSRINHTTLVPIESLIGIEFDPSNPSFISIIGILSRNPSNPEQFFIEDQHAHVPIDFSNTVPILISFHF